MQTDISRCPLSPLGVLKPRQLLLMLTMQFDGSGKKDDPNTRYVTLAGFAAQQETWEHFNVAWRERLADCGNPRYMHMNEAIMHEGQFSGWTEEKTDILRP
jgi:hypothetical protein